ncbi:hypothetical protein NFI96_003672 [Prochilodus magdalenae]|nr:hypothetical protein NFI96_003672 [Prochilodus magdalenae]
MKVALPKSSSESLKTVKQIVHRLVCFFLFGMELICMALLILFGYAEPRSELLKLVGPDAPLVVEAGEDLVLPCSIASITSAVDMRVEWFRVDVTDLFVHLYETGADIHEQQDQSYRGRTALFKEELHKGNASLKLSAVQVSDEGAYKCLIRDESGYDDITVNVNVEVLGTQPVLTMEGYDNSGGINLACESRGWYPKPEVLWLDREGVTLTAEDTETHRDTEGFRVKRRITVYNSGSDRFYCRLHQRHHMKETEIIISKAEKKMLQDEAERKRLQDEAEKKMIQHEAERKRLQHEAERKRLQLEAERERIQHEAERERLQLVLVTPDPDIAHPELILSDGGNQVTHGETRQNVLTVQKDLTS